MATATDGAPLVLVAAHRSTDGTEKLVLRTADGHLTESVLIPGARRHTVCVSSQVGCALACRFCATGARGFSRDLDAAEIVAQVAHARARLADDDALTNVVFMGMGEPLLNLDAVRAAIRTLIDPRGYRLAPRRITVSTVGVVPHIRPLLELGPVNLAVSLHATTDAVRDRLMPLNRRYQLATLLEALRPEPILSRRRPVLFAYTLIAGVNDAADDAARLPALLAGIPCRLNVIPMNPIPGSPDRAPDADTLARFTAVAHQGGLRVMVRRHRGADVTAACGQLAASASGDLR